MLSWMGWIWWGVLLSGESCWVYVVCLFRVLGGTGDGLILLFGFSQDLLFPMFRVGDRGVGFVGVVLTWVVGGHQEKKQSEP